MKQIFLLGVLFIVMASKLNAQAPLRNKTEPLENMVLVSQQSFDYDNYQPIELHLQQSQRTKKASKFLMKASAVLLVVGVSSLIYANTFPADPANGFYLLPGPQTGFQLLGILGIGGAIGTGIPGVLLYRREQRKQKTTETFYDEPLAPISIGA